MVAAAVTSGLVLRARVTTRLLDLLPVEERFDLAKAFIETACAFFDSDARGIVRRVLVNLKWDNYWSDDVKQDAWFDLIKDNPQEALDLAERVMAWLMNPSEEVRYLLIDDLRVT